MLSIEVDCASGVLSTLTIWKSNRSEKGDFVAVAAATFSISTRQSLPTNELLRKTLTLAVCAGVLDADAAPFMLNPSITRAARPMNRNHANLLMRFVLLS